MKEVKAEVVAEKAEAYKGMASCPYRLICRYEVCISGRTNGGLGVGLTSFKK